MKRLSSPHPKITELEVKVSQHLTDSNLSHFLRGTETDYENLPILVKAKGKFTTDHISMAGPWLKYRGHLENISGNLYLGAVNAFEGYEVGYGKNLLTGEIQTFPEIAKSYHEANQPWVVIGDENR